jgi:PKD repeat protein
LVFGLALGIFHTSRLQAQISEKGLPESFFLEQKTALILPTLKLDPLPVSQLLEEDRKFIVNNRYGVVQQCEIDLKKSGIKTEISGKGTIWQYKLESENALSLGVFFKKYRLPEKAKVFIYDAAKTKIRGAFTSKNNNLQDILPVAEFQGNQLIIEYFEPEGAEFSGELMIGAVSQAYLDVQKLLEDRIGINCEAGKDWQIIKHSVCLMTFHDFTNSFFCTGTLINNVKEDETPYFLTANHCINSELTATTLITYFNYENTTCDSSDAAFTQTLAGASFKAGSQHSDFSLLLLNEYPPDEYNPFFAGWDVTGDNPRSTACIHHPEGTPKSIALANNTAFSYPEKIQWFSEDLRLISTTMPDTHWHALFTQGLPETGSSGGPLFDQNKRIVGQLHGGVNNVLLFGKLALSWDFHPEPTRQLAYWLDPNKTRKTMDGIWKMPPRSNFRAELQEVCVNAPIPFYDQSTHKPTEWYWEIDPPTYSFANGTDSATRNPVILFENDGAYSVKLRTSNKYGSHEIIQNKYIMAKSKLDVRFQRAKRDSVVCGSDLLSFPLKAGGALAYSFKTDRPDLIETISDGNTMLLTLNRNLDLRKSFDTWVKVTGTNAQCVASDSMLLHVIIQPNDHIRYAEHLYLGRNTGYTNHCATAELNEPNPPSAGCTVNKSWCPDFRPDRGLLDNSIWFTFVAPSNGTLSINTSGFDNQIALYLAENAEAVMSNDKKRYSLVAANDNRSVADKTAHLENLELEPGKQYWLQVDGNNAAFGNLTIDLISKSLEALVFPNPSTGRFNINIFHPDMGIAEVSVTDLNGRKLFAREYALNLTTTEFSFDLTGYPKGLYFLQVHLNGESLNKKIVYQ